MKFKTKNYLILFSVIIIIFIITHLIRFNKAAALKESDIINGNPTADAEIVFLQGYDMIESFSDSNGKTIYVDSPGNAYKVSMFGLKKDKELYGLKKCVNFSGKSFLLYSDGRLVINDNAGNQVTENHISDISVGKNFIAVLTNIGEVIIKKNDNTETTLAFPDKMSSIEASDGAVYAWNNQGGLYYCGIESGFETVFGTINTAYKISDLKINSAFGISGSVMFIDKLGDMYFWGNYNCKYAPDDYYDMWEKALENVTLQQAMLIEKNVKTICGFEPIKEYFVILNEHELWWCFQDSKYQLMDNVEKAFVSNGMITIKTIDKRYFRYKIDHDIYY